MNVPLAYGFATIIGVFARQWFAPALVVGYWLTNVLGFVLLHVGGVEVLTGGSDEGTTYGRREVVVDLLLSVGYTILVLVLVAQGVLTFPEGVTP